MASPDVLQKDCGADDNVPGHLHVKDAPSPFDKPSADVILRTIDHVDFRARQGILMEASSVFEGMFSLPVDLNGSRKRKERSSDDEYRDGVPVVSVSETSRTLNHLLRFCYPMENPHVETAEEVCEVLEASRKYLMDQAEQDISAHFLAFAKKQPLVLYALAARHGWKEEMRIAAKESLRMHFVPGTFVPEMESITGGQYMRLQVYHQNCAIAADSAVWKNYNTCEVMSTMKERIWFQCRRPKPPTILAGLPPLPSLPSMSLWYADEHSGTPQQLRMVQWMSDFLREIKSELRKCPHADTVRSSLFVSKCIRDGIKHCSECAPRVPGDVQALVEALATHVEKAVADVSTSVRVAVSFCLTLLTSL